jgi:hypothetical protein
MSLLLKIAVELKSNKNILRFFGLLDIISIVLMSQQIYSICINYDHIFDQTASKIKITLLVLGYLLLFISAPGLLRFKKFGIVTYYIQFPIRLLVWIFSFGFITYINDYIADPDVSHWILRVVVMMEFFRLYFTIKIHRIFF